jgi:hypothetical protein
MHILCLYVTKIEYTYSESAFSSILYNSSALTFNYGGRKIYFYKENYIKELSLHRS